MKCIYCGSEDVVYLKFHRKWACNTCGKSFDDAASPKTDEELKVFFSYAHDDSGSENGAVVVDALKQLIEKKSGGKIKVWMDTHSITRDGNWRESITNGIISSNRFVGFMSQKALRNPGVCRDELGIAVGSRYGIISCVLLENERTLNPPAEYVERQWIDLSDWKKKRDEGEAEFERFLNDAADELISILRDPETLRFNHEVKKLKESLGISAVDEMTRIDEQLKFKMTGRGWLAEKINNWMHDPNGKRVMTLYAAPGAGKSLFTAHFQFANPNVIAALACDSRSDEFSKTDRITDRLAYLIALRMPDYRSILLEVLKDKTVFSKTGMDRFNTLIATPLSRLINGQRSAKLIIIDGLDEAKGGELADYIRACQSVLQSYIRILITARPERGLKQRLAPAAEFSCTELDLGDYTEMNNDDLRHYCTENLSALLADRPGREEFIDRLVEASSGIFYYAYTILPELREFLESGEPLEKMDFPRGLDALLLRTFLRKFGEPDASGMVVNYNAYVRTPLSIVAASPYTLPIKTLQKMQDWTDAELEDFLRPLETLLDLSGGFIRLFHKSFTDWLNDSEASAAFYAPQEDGIRSLAAACFKAFEQGADEMDTYELANASRLLRSAGMKKEYEQLTDSSEYTSALKKLAKAYAYDRQHDRAAELYLEYAQIFKVKCENSGNPDHAHEALGSYAYACDALRAMLDYPAAEAAANAALEIAEEFAKRFPDAPQMQHDLRVVYNKMGDIPYDRNDYNTAKIYYTMAFEISVKLANMFPNDITMQRALSIAYNNLSDIAKKYNDYNAAEIYCMKTLEIRKSLAEKYPSDMDLQRSLSVAYNNLGNIAYARNDFSSAERNYLMAQKIRITLAEMFPNDPEMQRNLSTSYEKLGGIAEALNDYKAAEGYYAKGLAISKLLAERYPDDPQIQRDLSISYERLGDIAGSRNNYKEARKYYTKTYKIKLFAKRYPKVPQAQRDLSRAYSRLGNIASSMNDYEAAREYYAKELEISKLLAERYPDDPQLQRDLSVSYNSLGNIAGSLNDYGAAREYYAKGLEIMRLLAERYPDDPQAQRDLSVSYDRLGDIASSLNDYNAAREYYAKGLEISKLLAKRYPKVPQVREDLAVSLFKSGICSEDGKLTTEQKSMLLYAAAISKELYKQTGHRKYKRRADIAEAARKRQ